MTTKHRYPTILTSLTLLPALTGIGTWFEFGELFYRLLEMMGG